MIYIYDILVNFMDGNRIYEFFEWNSKDIIEHIKKIPLIKVDDKVFFDLINNDCIIDNKFLEDIKNKTLTYSEVIEYASIISNGKKCYVFEFNKNGEIMYKSSMLLDEEEDTLICSNKLEYYNLNYNVVKIIKEKEIKTTREEERKILIIKKDLEQAYTNNIDKIDYIFNEVYKNSRVKNKYKYLIENLNMTNINKIYNIISMEKKKKNAI